MVHLHAASRRHFDLRLEVGPTLTSFALPKGPTLDPADKRLAVNTEDHPIEYLDFEDVIPAGSYGAGSMIVWDVGRVSYLETTAEEGLVAGKLDFVLSGHKLRGRFALVHTGARARPGSADTKQWLLIKKDDAHSRPGFDVAAEEPRSVLSGLLVEELVRARQIAAELEEEATRLGAPLGHVDARRLEPMLCSSSGAGLDDARRLYELKLDGVRIVAERRDGEVNLRYRRRRSASAAFPEIVRAVGALPGTALVLDGEVVAFDDRGRPSFSKLARRIHVSAPDEVTRLGAEVPVIYMAFDLLQLGERDLTGLPLHQRKHLLARLIAGRGLVRSLDHLEGHGQALFDFCADHGLEGVVAKRADSRYRPGPTRSPDWVKIKRQRQDDFVVVGWEESDKARLLRSLLIAAYDGPRLVLRGKVGSGLDDATIEWLLKQLADHEVGSAAAEGSVAQRGPRHWVVPQLVVRVEHVGLSDSGLVRFPVFRGMRSDLAPRDCLLTPNVDVIDRGMASVSAAADHAGLDDPQRRARRAKLSNQNKIFWPVDGYSKGDLCAYYATIADTLLPYLRGRPLVLVRYPDGVEGKSFFQWNVPRGAPSWLRSLELREEGEGGKGRKRVFLVDDVDGLLYVANLGCIPIHVLASREDSSEACDFVTVDFDLGRAPLRHAVSLALDLRNLLEQVGLVGMPKTSGQTGIHVLIPLGPEIGFAAARALADLLGRWLVDRHPDIATVERVVERRGERVYVDTGQTGRSRTIVAPYSVRATRGARVSTPLDWDEVHAALDPGRFTMVTVPRRVAGSGDPMQSLLTLRPDVAAAVEELGRRIGA